MVRLLTAGTTKAAAIKPKAAQSQSGICACVNSKNIREQCNKYSVAFRPECERESNKKNYIDSQICSDRMWQRCVRKLSIDEAQPSATKAFATEDSVTKVHDLL